MKIAPLSLWEMWINKAPPFMEKHFIKSRMICNKWLRDVLVQKELPFHIHPVKADHGMLG